MNERRDLGITLVTVTLLLLGMTYFAQCTAARRAPTAEVAAPPSLSPSAHAAAVKPKEAAHGEALGEEDDEERAKIRNVAHALQTIAANPELRRTYGLPK